MTVSELITGKHYAYDNPHAPLRKGIYTFSSMRMNYRGENVLIFHKINSIDRFCETHTFAEWTLKWFREV